jgi:tRNA (cytidine/uridine-2'-O-)-methyltransferase
MKSSAQINIVLVEPEIPQNTGNIGRTCVGLGAPLHLVGKLGFSLADKDLKRAGLDYWPKLSVTCYADWNTFIGTVPKEADLCFLSTKGTTLLWDRAFSNSKPLYLIFGSESKGLPPELFKTYAGKFVRIPTNYDIRSLNLSTAAGVVAFEAARQLEKAAC